MRQKEGARKTHRHKHRYRHTNTHLVFLKKAANVCFALMEDRGGVIEPTLEGSQLSAHLIRRLKHHVVLTFIILQHWQRGTGADQPQA